MEKMLSHRMRSPASGGLACGRRSVPRRVVSVRASGPSDGQKYDYIISGGGTAGCVLANKLTADGKTRVLMLEAGGGADSLEVAVPAGLSRLFGHPVLDWGLKTVLQKQLDTRQIYLARGRLLGGSSCTNATLYHRGSAADYDGWGLDGWRAQDVLDWFKRSEDNQNGANSYHGVGGMMHVESPRYDNPLHEAFFKAAAAAGIKPNPDFNDWSHPQAGYGEFQVTQKSGERADMYRMALKPALSRGNLQVVKNARATKVQTEKSSSGVTRARGVDYNIGGEFGERFSAELNPDGEVIVCTGAVHTPQLLMLSGIGPAKHLKEHGIPVVVDSPAVGANLQDHPACLLASRMKAEFPRDLTITGQIYSETSNIRKSAVFQYLFGRRGPLTSTGCDHGAFVSTTGSGEPDLQIRFVPGCALDPDGVSSYIKFGELKKQGQAWPTGITLQLLAIRAKSRGSVSLHSANPFTPPAIDSGYFTDAADLATLKAGLAISRKLVAEEPIAKYLSHEQFPGATARGDAELEDYVRRTVHSGNALVGTARMGASIKAGAAVSSRDLSVFGVQGLRVVDASVLPRITGGQTGAPTIMVAERAAAAMLAGREGREGSFTGVERVAVPA